MLYLLAALGGALGALARWAVALALPSGSGDWPWATLTVNLGGCLLIGVLLGAVAVRRPDDVRLRAFVGTGVLGGFTTFSAFSLDALTLLQAGRPVLAALYVAGSVLGGLGLCALGWRMVG